jgi:CheY-like chemotaxis protein
MATLLMLDDDEHALMWMVAALEGRGHRVFAFTTARAALRALNASPPDLIVADILMPESDGLEFAKLARRHRDVPVLFVSIARKQAEAVLVGASGYVQKPATAAEIGAAVSRILGEGSRRNTILLVDDQTTVHDVYRAILEPRFSVLTACNGVEALETMRAQRVDLAIVDVHMPIMNGADLVRAMRSDPELQGIPVIVQTSDVSALRAPVWGQLRVAQVMDKEAFLDWFDSLVRTHMPAGED